MVRHQSSKLSRNLEITNSYLRKMSYPATIAGMAGTLLDLHKGNVALHAQAKCIMREAA